MAKTPRQQTRKPNKTNHKRPNKKTSWDYFFIDINIVQAIGIAICAFVLLRTIHRTAAGTDTKMEGFELVGLVPLAGVVALINIVTILIYLIKHRPHGKKLVTRLLSLLLSVSFIAFWPIFLAAT